MNQNLFKFIGSIVIGALFAIAGWWIFAYIGYNVPGIQYRFNAYEIATVFSAIVYTGIVALITILAAKHHWEEYEKRQ